MREGVPPFVEPESAGIPETWVDAAPEETVFVEEKLGRAGAMSRGGSRCVGAGEVEEEGLGAERKPPRIRGRLSVQFRVERKVW